MRIGIDVESGEHSFKELVSGALLSSDIHSDISFFLIGNSNKIRQSYPEIDKYSKFFLVDSKDHIAMDESPSFAVKRKKDATINVGMELLKQNTIDVLFSPGNTGATVVSAVLHLGVLNTIKKPALASFFPRKDGGETLILDVGANTESKEENIFHNALLGTEFYSIFNNKKKPSVGLLSVGTEFGKGSHMTKKSFNLLKNMHNFIGNVEAYNLTNGSVDVVVCDGFTGNSIIKISESMKDFFIHKTKKLFSLHNSSNTLFKVFKRKGKSVLLSKLKHSLLPEYYGGAILLGVKGVVLVGHGMSSKDDVINAVKLAKKLYDLNMYERLSNKIEKR